MKPDLSDLTAFVTVARARGFRDGARLSGASASSLSEAIRRLETQLGVRLLNRTTRSVAATEAGQRLLERLAPALSEIEDAIDVVNRFRDRPAGTLRLNVPTSAARLVLPAIVPPFLAAYPDITLDIIADETITTESEGVMEFMAKVNHPALAMWDITEPSPEAAAVDAAREAVLQG